MIFIKGENLSRGIYPRCKIQYVMAKPNLESMVLVHYFFEDG